MAIFFSKNRRAFHPAVSISSWLIFAAAVEFCSPQLLIWLAVPASLLVFDKEAGSRFLVLLWKLRWLLLALVLLYAFTVPGVHVWQGNYSPSYEGLQMGGLRVARLLLLLMALARLLVALSSDQIAAGLYVLSGPFSSLGLDRRGLAVRLALTLEQASARGSKADWLAELRSASRSEEGPEQIRLTLPSVGPPDAALLLAALATLGIGLA